MMQIKNDSLEKPKVVEIGFGTLRNEEIDCIGWAKTLQYFCKRVVALVDPDTIDKTIDILKEKCPWVEIQFQDRRLGDSDENTQGSEESLIMHNNHNKFIRENIEKDSWFLLLSGDERFNPFTFNQLSLEVLYAQKNDYECVYHERVIEPINCYESQLSYFDGKWFMDPYIEKRGRFFEMKFAIEHGNVQQARFMRNTNFIHNSGPHQGYNERFNLLMSNATNLFHFHRIKYNNVLPTSWRDKKGAISRTLEINGNKLPLIPMWIPFSNENWKTLDPLYIDNNSELEEFNRSERSKYEIWKRNNPIKSKSKKTELNSKEVIKNKYENFEGCILP